MDLDEEIRRLEEELKRKKEQRRKIQELGNSGVLHTQQTDENSRSTKKSTDFTTEDTNQHIKDVNEESMYAKKGEQIDTETTNKSFLEKTFQKRSGTTDKGKKYEDMIMANVILQMVSDTKIADFNISSNDASFGDFDDVVIQIETDRGIETTAMQLKHSSRGNLAIQQLASKRGDFSISKYFNSAQNLLDKAQQFILFTNNKLNIPDKPKFKLEGEEFYLESKKVLPSESSYEVSEISKNVNYCYKFEIIEDQRTKENLEKVHQYQTFFDRFRLYTNQEPLETLTTSTMDRFTKMFCSNEEIFNAYFKFISEWSMKQGTKEKLSKKLTQRLIALRLLSPHIEPLAFGPVSDEMTILRDAICHFDITLLGKEGSNEVKKLWGDLNKNIDLKELNQVRSRYCLSSANISTVENLDANMLSQLLWLMDKCPLIVKEHENVEKAIQLCRDTKFVLLGEGKCKKWMKVRSLFHNLSDLESKLESFEKVLKKFTISLQGKNAFNLETAFEQNEDFLKHVTVNKLLEMSNGSCYIGGQKETFPNIYIDRYLSVNIIDIKYLEHVNQNTVIVLNCEENLEQLKVSKKHILLDINDFLSNRDSKISRTPVIIITKNKCSESEFHKICSKIIDSKIVHHFNFLNNKTLEWIRSRGDISELRNYKLSDHSKNEKEFWSFDLNNNINLITGDPGMGKTELTKSLKNNCCSKHWTVIMTPQDINSLCKTLQTCDVSDYLNRFESFILNEKYRHLERFDREFFKMCLVQNNVVYVWDALDEILTINLDVVSDLILILSQKGFIQWVTARQHLMSFLETKFNVLSMGINQFSETEQEDYIRKRFSSIISSDDMERTIEKIKSTFAFTKHIDILGIPLQIYMLTEIFRQNKEIYLELLNNKFILTDLYRYFIDGKFKAFFGGKVPLNDDYWEEDVRKKKEEKLKQYEKFALELMFPEESLKQLKIDCSRDVNLVSEDFATVGIVTGLPNGIPQFVHASFAEYFVSLYFSRNFEVLQPGIFFDQKYNNIRFFFDMLVGEKSPAHIAILYRDFAELRNFNHGIIKRKDECGRSGLHLICSWGQRYPRLNVHESNDGYVIEDGNRRFNDLLETREYFDALLFVLNICEMSEDLLFKITPLECSRESESLGAELQLLESGKLQIQLSYSKNDRINILYHSARLGYEEVIKLVTSENFGPCYKEVNFRTASLGETLLSVASKKGNTTVAEYLVKCGAEINRADRKGQTPLYAASVTGQEKTVECLVKWGAEINRIDQLGRTPLWAASWYAYNEIVQFLAKNGAETNTADNENRTPLHAASRNGNESIVECLVKYGAEINRAGRMDEIPLYAASWYGHEKTVECIVKCGAEVNRTDEDGRPPLYAASWNGHEKIAEYLVKCGAEINRENSNGVTPLYAASENGHEKTVTCLVKCGAEINRSNKRGGTPLFVAALMGHEKVVECLVKHRAKINSADNASRTPLYIASWNGYENIVQCLVKNGAEINGTDNAGRTPLHAASRNGNQNIVECLVKCGAEINRADSDGCTPLYRASENQHTKVAEFLLANGAH
ncbi:uncharacterized protein LOC135138368 [Zophobas morio]|uniref:uncharacterized protein LOC135138368 n=1 Tax=Zophobas morio TaxID=2755281 RepID=UPI003083ABA4